jgi:hypothetical protein
MSRSSKKRNNFDGAGNLTSSGSGSGSDSARTASTFFPRFRSLKGHDVSAALLLLLTFIFIIYLLTSATFFKSQE